MDRLITLVFKPVAEQNALGKTDKNKRLFVAFTIRNNLIRVISARDMSRKERDIYKSL